MTLQLIPTQTWIHRDFITCYHHGNI